MQIWINIALTFRANRLYHNIIKINKADSRLTTAAISLQEHQE